MPSYNGVVATSCIRTLANIAIRFSYALSIVSYFLHEMNLANCWILQVVISLVLWGEFLVTPGSFYRIRNE